MHALIGRIQAKCKGWYVAHDKSLINDSDDEWDDEDGKNRELGASLESYPETTASAQISPFTGRKDGVGHHDPCTFCVRTRKHAGDWDPLAETLQSCEVLE